MVTLEVLQQGPAMPIPTAHEKHEEGARKAAATKQEHQDPESHAIADAADAEIPKGTPNADRHQAETAVRHEK